MWDFSDSANHNGSVVVQFFVPLHFCTFCTRTPQQSNYRCSAFYGSIFILHGMPTPFSFEIHPSLFQIFLHIHIFFKKNIEVCFFGGMLLPSIIKQRWLRHAQRNLFKVIHYWQPKKGGPIVRLGCVEVLYLLPFCTWTPTIVFESQLQWYLAYL